MLTPAMPLPIRHPVTVPTTGTWETRIAPKTQPPMPLIHSISEAGFVPQHTILDKAAVPGLPFSPNKKIIITTGILLGIVISLIILILRYVLKNTITSIDEITKLAFARLYKSHSSKQAADFLKRLHYLTEGEIVNLHHDNGSEFQKDFEIACKELSLPQWSPYHRSPQ